MKVIVGLVALVAVGGGQAWAQATEPAAGAALAPASPAQATDPEIAGFALATLKLHALNQPTPEQMSDAITGAGLSVQRYNEIAARMQRDPALQVRVNAALIQAEKQAPAAAGPPPPPPPPPPLPTTGVGAVVLTVLDKACVPMVRQHEAVAQAGPQAGLKPKPDGSYSGPLGQAPYSITVLPRGSNQAVCQAEIRYPLGSGQAIATALNIWSMHQPGMKMVRNDAGVGPDGLKRITLSWEQAGPAGSAGLVFVRTDHADGTPIEKGAGSATLLYSASAG